MQITLKKFSKNPKQIIKKAPITIIINRQPAYVIIPYSIYKANLQTSTPTHLNGTAFYQGPVKKHSRLYRLFFE